VSDTHLPVVYLNLLGGQDELVFDGGSFVMNAAGDVVQRAPSFKEGVFVVDVNLTNGVAVPVPGHIEALAAEEASVYGALVLGVRDYVNKHKFPGVVIGLSGGVDSALTLALAGSRPSACRDDAIALHLAAESRRSCGASEVVKGALRRDSD
jgi:NAD+ synthase (glutamine-hydrolysing)